jgi:hypothetical protein
MSHLGSTGEPKKKRAKTDNDPNFVAEEEENEFDHVIPSDSHVCAIPLCD